MKSFLARSFASRFIIIICQRTPIQLAAFLCMFGNRIYWCDVQQTFSLSKWFFLRARWELSKFGLHVHIECRFHDALISFFFFSPVDLFHSNSSYRRLWTLLFFFFSLLRYFVVFYVIKKCSENISKELVGLEKYHLRWEWAKELERLL